MPIRGQWSGGAGSAATLRVAIGVLSTSAVTWVNKEGATIMLGMTDKTGNPVIDVIQKPAGAGFFTCPGRETGYRYCKITRALSRPDVAVQQYQVS